MALPQDTFNNRVRVGGSGYTVFLFGGQPIVYAQQVSHTSPQPVSPATPIHPMDEPYAVEIITPAAAGPGTLTFNLYELYGSTVVERLGASVTGRSGSGVTSAGATIATPSSTFSQAVDIVDVFIKQAQADPASLMVVKFIRPLPTAGSANKPVNPYSEEYHGCAITNVIEGEQIEVGTMEVIKQVTVMYRYKTRSGAASQAFTIRDRSNSPQTN